MTDKTDYVICLKIKFGANKNFTRYEPVTLPAGTEILEVKTRSKFWPQLNKIFTVSGRPPKDKRTDGEGQPRG